jgi:cell wall-associated NlpC family hydrolase
MLRRSHSCLRGARATAVCAVIVAASLLPAPTALASHGGGPTAQQIAASKARVAHLEHQVATAAAIVARNQQALAELQVSAEVATEAYNRAQITEAAAQNDVQAAQLVLDAAASRVHSARSQVERFAVAAYEGGGLSTVDAVLTAGGPQTLLYRLSALDAVSRSQSNVVAALSAAQVYQRAVKAQAAHVLARAQAAAKAADAARARAQSLVAKQVAAVDSVKTAQRRLTRLLATARQHASALERARLAAIARAKAEALARAQAAAAAKRRVQLEQAGGTVSFANTVSASTEQAALQYAESQIGKPYQWGAAGPDTYDCSGLVMWSYSHVGVNIDHWTGFQWNEGAHIPLSSLRPGDLLFFAYDTNDTNTIHHVGMYVGGGQMVEAPYTGANVRISNAFRGDLIGAVRLYAR